MIQHERLIQAVQRATRKLVSSGNFDLLMKDVLLICVEAVGAWGGTIYLHEPATKRLRFQHVLPEQVSDKLPTLDIPEDYGMAGEAFMSRQTVCRDIAPKPADQQNQFEQATGVTVYSMVATPLMMENETPIGVVQLLNKREGVFTLADIAVLDTIAAVATMAFMNYRLTEESVRASSLLGMGKVSHDIGNLAASLHANILFSDLAIGQMRDALPPGDSVTQHLESLAEMLQDLKASVDGIVGYARLISDISAGRSIRPTFICSSMADTIRSSAEFMEADARACRVEICYDIQPDAPPTCHDPLYINRIVQNLVVNAIKAIKEHPEDAEIGRPGQVLVRYVFQENEHILEVSDTGPGIERSVAQMILSGNARSQWQRGSGSGWGTKIVLELAAAHNARLSIDNNQGQGSTFRVSLPHRAS